MEYWLFIECKGKNLMAMAMAITMAITMAMSIAMEDVHTQHASHGHPAKRAAYARPPLTLLLPLKLLAIAILVASRLAPPAPTTACINNASALLGDIAENKIQTKACLE